MSIAEIAASRRSFTERQSFFRSPPVWTQVSLALTAAVLLVYGLEIEIPVLATLQETTVYKYVSGLAVLSYILIQWQLFLSRESDAAPKSVARWYHWHKMLGAFAPALLLLHAGTIGFGVSLALSSLFFVTLLTGVFNREFIATRSQVFWKAWTVIHVGSAFGLYALIALHVWIAIKFTG